MSCPILTPKRESRKPFNEGTLQALQEALEGEKRRTATLASEATALLTTLGTVAAERDLAYAWARDARGLLKTVLKNQNGKAKSEAEIEEILRNAEMYLDLPRRTHVPAILIERHAVLSCEPEASRRVKQGEE
jgi:hypothetical protein